MRLSNIGFWLQHPTALTNRIYRAFYDRSHPGEPWIAVGAIRFLERALRPDMRALEWGSGRSTAWYASRVGSLLSIEHHAEWFARVRPMLAGLPNSELRLIAMDPAKENGLVHLRPDLPAYVAVADDFADESLDFVVVDGQYRISCAVAVQPKLMPGGYLLVDDEQTFPQLRAGLIPKEWPIVCSAKSGPARTTIWQKPG